MNADDLERLVDDELKRLPAPRAPETLLPRVLRATVDRRPAPWYARPWLEWPRGWQVASSAALVAIGAALSTLVSFLLGASAGARTAAAVELPAGIRQLFSTIQEAAALMRVLWEVLVQPAAFWLMVLAVSLSLVCAALWSALERAAVGGASQQ